MSSLGREKLADGSYNFMSQEWQPDGSVIITLTRRGEGKTYKLRIKDLYLPTEQVLSDEVIEI